MSSSTTVLIIDDDPDFTIAVRHLLESAGYAVRTAADGEAGFKAALETRPAVILLDIMMRERTEGFFTLERIRATPSLQTTPVVVISSIYTEWPAFSVAPDAGWLPADLFLAKPVEPARLLAEVARFASAAAGTPPREAGARP